MVVLKTNITNFNGGGAKVKYKKCASLLWIYKYEKGKGREIIWKRDKILRQNLRPYVLPDTCLRRVHAMHIGEKERKSQCRGAPKNGKISKLIIGIPNIITRWLVNRLKPINRGLCRKGSAENGHVDVSNRLNINRVFADITGCTTSGYKTHHGTRWLNTMCRAAINNRL